MRDLAGVHLDHLARAGAAALLTRPDFYVFGAAAGAPELAALTDALLDQRHVRGVAAGD